MRNRLYSVLLCMLFVAGCVRNQPDVIVITATFEGDIAVTRDEFTSPTLVPTVDANAPTPDPSRGIVTPTGGDYVVKAGDTLTIIAANNGASVPSILALNPELINPDLLEVGQIIKLPGAPTERGSEFKIIPDAKLVYGPGAHRFDVDAFISQQIGYIKVASDIVNGVPHTAAEAITRAAQEYSVDARLLLALLEYKSGWLSNPTPSETAILYPMGLTESGLTLNRSGLYRQLIWAADQLNRGYYGWKHRGLSTIEFTDGQRLLYAEGLNAGTVSLQYLLSINNDYLTWQRMVSPDGFYRTYTAYFNDPFADAIDPLVPANLQQPSLGLPFPQGETWYFTGGPHGGWGSGSAWAAIDFAPPDELKPGMSSCYVSEYYATAVADGVIARTAEGTVMLDLDGDGDDTTGWVVMYLHIAEQGRIREGTQVRAGDRIGHPSCEGGFSNGTHMHIARKYNGEWIPAICDNCPAGQERPPFVMNGWTTIGRDGREYQGYLVNGNQRRIAEQMRGVAENHISW